MNEQTAERLEMRWRSVTDSAGRTRMEATWVRTSAVTPAAQHPITPAA